MEETVREALRMIFAALKTGNVERFAEFIAPEVVWENLSHEIIVAGYGPKGIEAIHHYIYDLHEFDEFWSGP